MHIYTIVLFADSLCLSLSLCSVKEECVLIQYIYEGLEKKGQKE